MPLRDAIALLSYWDISPPEHELMSLFARIYTTWTPGGKAKTEEEARVEHQKSLEERWAAGAMSAKDLVGTMGGMQHTFTAS